MYIFAVIDNKRYILLSFSEDIIRYITLQMVPTQGGSKPRLSLYLASQLMFGTVAVYDKQHEYLFSKSAVYVVIGLNKKFPVDCELSGYFSHVLTQYNIYRCIRLVPKRSPYKHMLLR